MKIVIKNDKAFGESTSVTVEEEFTVAELMQTVKEEAVFNNHKGSDSWCLARFDGTRYLSPPLQNSSDRHSKTFYILCYNKINTKTQTVLLILFCVGYHQAPQQHNLKLQTAQLMNVMIWIISKYTLKPHSSHFIIKFCNTIKYWYASSILILKN